MTGEKRNRTDTEQRKFSMIDAICAISDISKNPFNIEFVNYHRATKLDITNILSFEKFSFLHFFSFLITTFLFTCKSLE